MHINPLLTTSILALAASTIAWNDQDSYDLHARDADLYAEDYAYSLYARDAEPEFLDWDIDTLHPRDAYALGLEIAGLTTRDAYAYPAAPAKGSAPAKAAPAPAKAAAPAKAGTSAKAAAPAKAPTAQMKADLVATAKKQQTAVTKAEKALQATIGKEKSLGMKTRRDLENGWEY